MIFSVVSIILVTFIQMNEEIKKFRSILSHISMIALVKKSHKSRVEKKFDLANWSRLKHTFRFSIIRQDGRTVK